MQVLKPPSLLPYSSPEYTIFLAGTIDMGQSENWQEDLTRILQPLPGIILNPRREGWDNSWEQKFENVKFKEQVEWELDALDMADRILMYFVPESKSPISLLELGLHANSKKLVVCCPHGFWRKGNVDIICNRYEIQTVPTIHHFMDICELDLQMDDLIDLSKDDSVR